MDAKCLILKHPFACLKLSVWWNILIGQFVIAIDSFFWPKGTSCKGVNERKVCELVTPAWQLFAEAGLFIQSFRSLQVNGWETHESLHGMHNKKIEMYTFVFTKDTSLFLRSNWTRMMHCSSVFSIKLQILSLLRNWKTCNIFLWLCYWEMVWYLWNEL